MLEQLCSLSAGADNLDIFFVGNTVSINSDFYINKIKPDMVFIASFVGVLTQAFFKTPTT